MLLAGLGPVRIGKNCDRGLENAARGRRPRAAFSSPRSQFFPIRTDPKPANNMFISFFFPCGKAIPFFFSVLASSDRPRFSRFQKKKKVTQKAMTHCFKQFLL